MERNGPVSPPVPNLFSPVHDTTLDTIDSRHFFLCSWVKFEEDVEEGGSRWSKPHVATLSLHSLFELRSLLLNGPILLDADAQTLVQITDLAIDMMANSGHLPFNSKERVIHRAQS